MNWKELEKKLYNGYYDYITGGSIADLQDIFLELQEQGVILPKVIGDILQKLKQYKDNNNMISWKKLKDLAKLQASNTIDILYSYN